MATDHGRRQTRRRRRLDHKTTLPRVRAAIGLAAFGDQGVSPQSVRSEQSVESLERSGHSRQYTRNRSIGLP